MKIDSPSAQAAEIARLALALAERATTTETDGLRLAGSKEGAELLGVGPNHFNVLRRRRELPAPVAELACGPIWRVEDLEKWARAAVILREATA
jgi:hypothetical protein